jgi:hypothetical protein
VVISHQRPSIGAINGGQITLKSDATSGASPTVRAIGLTGIAKPLIRPRICNTIAVMNARAIAPSTCPASVSG